MVKGKESKLLVVWLLNSSKTATKDASDKTDTIQHEPN